MFPQKRLELVDDGYEGCEVNQRQAALQNKPREPIAIASAKELLNRIHSILSSDPRAVDRPIAH